MIFTKAKTSQEETRREVENRKISYKAATEGIVLLQNNGVLPLLTKKVALFGPGALMTIKGGTGSGEVKERRVISILDGMLERGYEIISLKWLEDYKKIYDEKYKEFKIAKKKKVNLLNVTGIMGQLAEEFQAPIGNKVERSLETDTCIYVISRQAGEAGDRKLEKGDYYLLDSEYEQIKLCTKYYKKVVLVINSGCSIDMKFVDEIKGIGAIIYLSQPGMEGGYALADVLDGTVNPSGKLAATWVNDYKDIPYSDEYAYLNGDIENANYKEGIYVGYRYFDSFNKPVRYPFGFGLSYTKFKINYLGHQVKGLDVKISVSVKNIGQFSGKEVVQLYLGKPSNRLSNVYQELVAFNKTKVLKPDELQNIELSFSLADFASYDEKYIAYILESGNYILKLGNCSRNTEDILCLVLKQDLDISAHEHVCNKIQSFTDLETKVIHQLGNIDKVNLVVDEYETRVFDYEYDPFLTDKRVNDFLAGLTVEEMAEILVGDGMFLFSNPIFHLPGSVGNTTSKLYDKGLINVSLCDGPAGIRLQKESGLNKNNKIKPFEMPIGFLEFLPWFVHKILKANPKKDKKLYQYATSFPVATALAQTWNTTLLNEVGLAIQKEMEEYGCTYWLAPAINIQMNPLCGRNFEYFSEDPFLTGKLASSIIKGIQSKEGFYATVKHFACNNQETNREHVSSNVSERALREIYTKAFKICVEEGKAKSVMTSYNKLNHTYTPNSYDLCTKLLRCEWGFDGVVMTDWYATKKNQGSQWLAIKSGNDLIMPGEGSAKKDIVNAVKKNLLSKEELYLACYNVVRSIFNSALYKEYMEETRNG